MNQQVVDASSPLKLRLGFRSIRLRIDGNDEIEYSALTHHTHSYTRWSAVPNKYHRVVVVVYNLIYQAHQIPFPFGMPGAQSDLGPENIQYQQPLPHSNPANI